MTELTVRQAREMLAAWAAEQDLVAGGAMTSSAPPSPPAQQERGSPADRHRADDRPHRQCPQAAEEGAQK
jgi:hypothetical protein